VNEQDGSYEESDLDIRGPADGSTHIRSPGALYMQRDMGMAKNQHNKKKKKKNKCCSFILFRGFRHLHRQKFTASQHDKKQF